MRQFRRLPRVESSRPAGQFAHSARLPAPPSGGVRLLNLLDLLAAVRTDRRTVIRDGLRSWRQPYPGAGKVP